MRLADGPDAPGGASAPIWTPPADRAAAIALLCEAVELGVNLVDTADAYALGAGEELVAEALHPYGDAVAVSTKVGVLRPSPTEWVPLGRPSYLRQQAELSLRRLRTDRIDLLHLHRLDPACPMADQVGALAQLQQEGKVRHIGLSEVTVEQLEEARRTAPIAAVQNLYNLAARDYEVRDWRADTTQTVAEFGHTVSARPSISGDGRYVAYQDGQAEDVFVWDRTDGTSSGPIEGSSKAATLVQLSKDGRKAVYLSGSDTYVHDVSSGTDQLVPDVRGVAIDPTGRYLLYAPHDTSGPSLTLRDLETGTEEIVSNQSASAGTDAVSVGGRDVVFHSTADDIVPGDTNGKSDVFVRRFY
ncbi:hypothetical protein GCM10022295_83470 [Streptomyces osmaniensis]|uniref:NADP-dependent oxidoreductase domain-containing protein n=2 Tax=Streptomyces osmaniensis TaxID=593134 RepID=A0ABP6YST1_9ACTN